MVEFSRVLQHGNTKIGFRLKKKKCTSVSAIMFCKQFSAYTVQADTSAILCSPYRRFNAIVSQLKMHYFSEGAFESIISSQLLKKEKYI